MKSNDFFDTHPVFTHSEFLNAHTSQGRSPNTSNNLLAMYIASGRLIRVRRGLYATVPRGVQPGGAVVDPYLVASHLTDDSVIAYHASLQFYGKVRSIWRRFHYVTSRRVRNVSFQDLEFIPVQTPAAQRTGFSRDTGVTDVPHQGGVIRVTTLERALVDVLDSPDKGGGWEEVWSSLEMVEFYDLDQVIDYAMKLGSDLTIARVGFYLEQHREPLMVEDTHLEILRARCPSQPRYFDTSRTSGILLARWNLIVPDFILNRRWREPGL